MKKHAMSRDSKRLPTTDPACSARDYHRNGVRCEKCGGIG